MSLPHNQDAAFQVAETSREIAEAQQHAAISANRLRYFLFNEDPSYPGAGLESTLGYGQELNESVENLYFIMGVQDRSKTIDVAVPHRGLKASWKPEINRSSFRLSLSPFFIEGFRIAKRSAGSEPYTNLTGYTITDRLEYDEHDLLVHERTAVTRFLKEHVGTESATPTIPLLSSLRDFILASTVSATGRVV